MRLYYRISDQSYPKPKLIGATKEVCLMNFVKAFHKVIFGNDGPPAKNWIPPMTIIADRCEGKTQRMLSNTGIPVVFTDYGNAGSLRHALKLSIEECEDDELAYFCEDDYLHLDESPVLLSEGLWNSDYVTLYDHPDKYTSQYGGGEISKVYKTYLSHWRHTISTCMTFAAKRKTIKEDIEVWEKYTQDPHPHDHYIFSELNKEKQRKLAVCIPGSACHVDLEYSSRVNCLLIEPWAINLMISQLEYELSNNALYNQQKPWINEKFGWDKLVALDAVRESSRLSKN
jgi:hypothetical protein